MQVRIARGLPAPPNVYVCMGHYLSDGALNSGALFMPDCRDWPDESELKELFRDIRDTSKRLSRAERRLSDF